MQRHTKAGSVWSPWVFSKVFFFFKGCNRKCEGAHILGAQKLIPQTASTPARRFREAKQCVSIPHLASCGKNRFAGVGIVWISCLQSSNHLGDSLCFHRQVKRGEKRKSLLWVA